LAASLAAGPAPAADVCETDPTVAGEAGEAGEAAGAAAGVAATGVAADDEALIAEEVTLGPPEQAVANNPTQAAAIILTQAPNQAPRIAA
jgi:hypothetical protein